MASKQALEPHSAIVSRWFTSSYPRLGNARVTPQTQHRTVQSWRCPSIALKPGTGTKEETCHRAPQAQPRRLPPGCGGEQVPEGPAVRVLAAVPDPGRRTRPRRSTARADGLVGEELNTPSCTSGVSCAITCSCGVPWKLDVLLQAQVHQHDLPNLIQLFDQLVHPGNDANIINLL